MPKLISEPHIFNIMQRSNLNPSKYKINENDNLVLFLNKIFSYLKKRKKLNRSKGGLGKKKTMVSKQISKISKYKTLRESEVESSRNTIFPNTSKIFII